ncbi:ABC transporter permease [Nonomuraea wenchangensis]
MSSSGITLTNRWARVSSLAPRGHGATTLVLLLTWLALVVATGLRAPGFISGQTVVAVAFNMAFVGIMVTGVGIVMLSGAEFDLSVGVTAVTSALIVAQLLVEGWAFPPAMLVAVLFGVLVGAVNAVLVLGLGIHPIVATLGMMFLVSGVTRIFVDFVAIPRDSFLRQQAAGAFLGAPKVFWLMLVIFVIAGLVTTYTRPGRHLVAVGGNAQAASARGISPRRVRGGAFVLCGLGAGVAGLVLASQGDIVQSSLTAGTEFRVISILLLGGMALTGGRGRFSGAFASLLLLSTLPTAIVTWGVSSSWQPVVEGLVLAVALAVNALREKKR